MVNKIISKGKQIFTSQQTSILSAAVVIMLMIVASRVLGLVRQRTLAHFFAAEELSLFFAAFRLPDLVFEVLVFGTFSSAFIPVFANLAKKDERDAWSVAASVTNIGLLVFAVLAVLVGVTSPFLYKIFAPGFTELQQGEIVRLTKILFAAQGFFVISYVLTGVLESLRRFLVPALAPIFYNIGIILGTLLFSNKLGLLAPALGVLLGAFAHFAVQLPLAVKLGFRFVPKIRIDEYVRRIGRLALPRVIEISFLQVSKMAELFFASLVSTASYTYYTFGNTLQLLPVGLFGTSIAKAALPTLATKADAKEEFARTLWKSLFEMTFLITPLATFLIVLRVPVVRLIYGTDIFTWSATVQTGMVVSAFAFSIIFQAAAALLARAFYALHDTKTPVVISIFSILLIIVFDFVFIKIFQTPIWGLAAAFSIGAFAQALLLFAMINRKINGGFSFKVTLPFVKHVLAAFLSGTTMFFFLKFFDRSVWVKRLSFLTQIETTKYLPFQKFVLDTRYTANLLVLTVIVTLLGIIVYLSVSWILKTRELWTFFNLIKRMFAGRRIGAVPEKEKESVVPMPTESGG